MRTAVLRPSLRRLTAVGVLAGLTAAGLTTGSAVAADEMEVRLEGGDLSVSGVPENLGNFAPGDARDWIVIMRNESPDAVAITGTIDQVSNDDDGCADPESDVDTSCGPAGGEAGDALLLSMPGSQGGAPIALSNRNSRLPTVTIPPYSSVERTLRLELPSETGNEVQSDRVQFRMVWTAEGPGFVTTAPDPDQKRGGLAFTGAWIGLFMLLAAGLLTVGSALVAAGRQRQESTD